MAKGTRRPPRLQPDRRLRDWLQSPQDRALRERVRRIPRLGFPGVDDEQPEHPPLESSAPPQPEPQEQSESLPAAQQSPALEPPKRPTARGRKRLFTDEEIDRLQAAYHVIRQDKPTLKQSGVFDALRALLPEDKRSVSDSTLRDHIVRPLPRE